MSRGRGVRAAEGQDCPLCQQPVRPGQPIAKTRRGWAHRACVEQEHGE